MSVIKVKDNNEFIDIATIQGPIGPQGEQGPIGVGVPADGSTAPGTFLAKTGASADATSWQNIFNLIYPVGSIYLSTNNANPGTFFGGSWEQIQDRFLLAAGSVYSAGVTGGEASHRHESPVTWGAPTNLNEAYVGTCNQFGSFDVRGQRGVYGSSVELRTENTGSFTEALGYYTNYSNNMPPYLVVYIWKRIS